MKVRDILTGYVRRNSISMSWKEADLVLMGELALDELYNQIAEWETMYE
jgi:hypothetical protein